MLVQPFTFQRTRVSQLVQPFTFQRTSGCLQFGVLKLLKHSGTYFYVNLSLRFSRINGHQCKLLVWRLKDFGQKTVESEGTYCPHAKNKKQNKTKIKTNKKNVRSSLGSSVWVTQATRTVKRLFMEEFVGPSIHKGPGIYQRQCVVRTIPQVELETLMCEYEQGTSIF